MSNSATTISSSNIEEKQVIYQIDRGSDADYLITKTLKGNILKRIWLINIIFWRSILNRSGYLTGIIESTENYFNKPNSQKPDRAKVLASAWEYVAGEIYLQEAEDSKTKDKAIERLERAIALNPSNHRAITAIAELYWQKGQYTKALESWQTMLSLVEKAKQTRDRIAIKLLIINNITKVYRRIGRIDEIEKIYTEEFFNKYEKEFPSVIANSYSRIVAAYYVNTPNLPKAEYYLDKSQKLIFKYLGINNYTQDKPLPIRLDENLVFLYNDLSLLNQLQGNFEEAIKYRKALTKISNTIDSASRILSNYFNMVILDLEMNVTERVITKIQHMDSIQSKQLRTNRYYRIAIKVLMGNYHLLYDYINRSPGGLSKDSITKAQEYFQNAYKLADNKHTNMGILGAMYCYEGNAYIKYGDYKTAINKYEQSAEAFNVFYAKSRNHSNIVVKEKIKSLKLLSKTSESEKEYLIDKLKIKESILPLF